MKGKCECKLKHRDNIKTALTEFGDEIQPRCIIKLDDVIQPDECVELEIKITEKRPTTHKFSQ